MRTPFVHADARPGLCPRTSASTPVPPSSSGSRRTCTGPSKRSARPTRRRGQVTEFDACCCRAALALREEGYETVMINCNPETVSTDYDTVDRLYFEPLTFEDVTAVIEREQTGGADVPCVVQYGGQTPLKLALSLQAAGVRILGTSPDSIDLAEDRAGSSQVL